MIPDLPKAHASVLPPLPELRSTTVFGQKICYFDLGDGPPLILVHGLGGDADEWVFCMQELSSSNRLIALDLLGFGLSDKPLIHYTIGGFVEVLKHFMNALKIERASLVGGSLGGWISAAFALKFPSRTDKLILVDPAGMQSKAHPMPIDLRISTRQHMHDVLNTMFYDQSFVTEELVDLAYQGHLRRQDGHTIDSALQNFKDEREWLDKKIEALNVPTLILWGEHDALIPSSTASRLHRLIKGSQLKIIPQCGHLPALEKPAEMVSHVTNFLQKS
jgi:pimeloyl-ACP methyl ester carboxylesterase